MVGIGLGQWIPRLAYEGIAFIFGNDGDQTPVKSVPEQIYDNAEETLREHYEDQLKEQGKIGDDSELILYPNGQWGEWGNI